MIRTKVRRCSSAGTKADSELQLKFQRPAPITPNPMLADVFSHFMVKSFDVLLSLAKPVLLELHSVLTMRKLAFSL